MAKIVTSTIRAAIKTALEDNATISGYGGTIIGYDGDIKNALKTEAVKYPVIIIKFSSKNYEMRNLNLQSWKRDTFFEIAVAVKNEISEEARVDGIGAIATGLWEIVDAVGDALIGRDLDLDIEKIQPISDTYIEDNLKWKVLIGKTTFKTREDFDVS